MMVCCTKTFRILWQIWKFIYLFIIYFFIVTNKYTSNIAEVYITTFSFFNLYFIYTFMWVLLLVLSCLMCNFCWLAVCIFVIVLCVLLFYVYLLYCVCIDVFTLDAGLLARSQYSEVPATGHLDTGFSRFPCPYKQTLRRFPTFQVATTCFSCSLTDLNLVVTYFIFCIHVK
jgi:apolipoprotein N-acyltransferase